MASNVVGLFDTHAQADNAIRELIAEGVSPGVISIIAADPDGRLQRQIADHPGDLTATGAATGAAGGLIVGTLIGLLVGSIAIAAPPVGFMIAGPVAGMLAGAGIGVASGGVLGAIVGLGVSESDAHVYAESVRRGGTVVSAEVTDDQRITAERVMARCGAASVEERGAQYRQEGFSSFDPSAFPYLAETEIGSASGTSLSTLPTQEAVREPGVSALDESLRVPVGMDDVFRQHFTASEQSITNLKYEQLRPAYRFGYEVSEIAPYQNRPWAQILPEVRQTWEDRNPGTWDDVAGAVHFGWSCLASPAALGVPPVIQTARLGTGEPKVL